MPEPRQDLPRTTMGVAFIAAMVAVSIWIMQPFIAAIVWATMIVVASWPAMLWLQRRLWNRRAAAVAVITVFLLLVVAVPLSVLVVRVAGSVGRVGEMVAQFREAGIPPPPAWVERLPLVGARVSAFWAETAAADMDQLREMATPYVVRSARWLVGEAGALGGLLVQFLLTVIVCAIMYATGEKAAAGVRAFARRLAGQNGENAVVLAGQAIRGVAMGVVVTAVVQTTLGGIGLAIAGVPFTALLTALMLMLCIAQVGPALVLFPATFWVFHADGPGWGTFMLVWTLVTVTLDNFLRPILIKLGADLPLLLIFAGVIGGLIGFGLVGVFVGPVVLAVSYTLVEAWVKAEGAAMPSSVQERKAG